MSDITVNLDNAVVVEVEVPAVTPVVVDPTGIPGDPGEQGNDGWTPVFAVVADGARRVQRVVDWEGGTGTKPTAGKYVGVGGFVDNIADAIDIRGGQGVPGAQGEPGEPGAVIIGEGADILTGEGPPDPGEGAENQLYLDTLSGDVYKKLNPGGWTIVANIRGPQGPAGEDGQQGEDGAQGADGIAGNNGWSAVLAIVNDGNRRVLQLQDWVGGQGTKPGNIGYYVSAAGLTNIIANAVDIRGPAGADGADGSAGLPGVAGRSIYNGSGAPSNGTGNNGDLYIDNANGDVYGPKTAGAWGSPVGNLTGPAGTDGTDGVDGAPGSQILVGAGVPDNALGVNSDFYLNTANGDYYKKAAGVWGASAGNLRGPQGIQGNPGNDGDDGEPGFSYLSGAGVPSSGFGNDGDSYLNTTNGDVYGPKLSGAWGSPTGNIRGPQGVPGNDGSDGADGAPGADGSDGAPGSQIYTGSGAPSDALGVDTDFYLNVTNGDVYKKAAGTWGSIAGNLRGPQGNPGADGSDGAPGSPGAPGDDGAPGADGVRGSIIVTGSALPSPPPGGYLDGDIFVDDVNWVVYQQISGDFEALGSIKGANGNDGADGDDGSPGAPGADGSIIYTDAGAPSDVLGANGDFYLNETNGDYYKKAAGTWGSPQGNLKGPQGDPGADGSPGSPGADGDDGAPGAPGSSFLSGPGAPGGGLGSNGDSYLNSSNGDVYGPKTGGSWGSPTGNIKGADGSNGADGADGSDGAPGSQIFVGSGAPNDANGVDGDFYLRTSNGDYYKKASGTWGSPAGNLMGPSGSPGTPGAPGADGDDGADGAPGASMLSGAGAPGGGTGSNGDSYLNTTTGDVYGPKSAGSWGSPTGNIKGAAGTAGSPGAAGATILSGSVIPGGGTGNNGDYYFRTNGDVYGPKTGGAWGSPIFNTTGPAGADAGEPLHYFRANKGVAQNGVAVSTPILVEWDTETDPNGEYNISTWRWTPTIEGPVQLIGSIQVTAAAGTFNANTNITIGFRKNGTVIGVANTRVQTTVATMQAFGAIMDSAVAGDYFDMYVQTGAVSSGTTYNINNSTACFFSGVTMVGSAGPQGPAGTPAYSFSANKNAVDQTGGNTYTKVTFTTEAHDDGGYYDAANSRWTPPAGPVAIEASVTQLSTSAGVFSVAIYKNGALFKENRINTASTSLNYSVQIGAVDKANGTDYYEVYANVAGGTVTIEGDANRTWFSGATLQGAPGVVDTGTLRDSAAPLTISGATGAITLDFSAALNYVIETVGSITITPTNLKDGQAFGIYFDKGSSAHTVTLSSQVTGGAATWKPIGGSAPSLNTADDYISGQRLDDRICYTGGSV